VSRSTAYAWHETRARSSRAGWPADHSRRRLSADDRTVIDAWRTRDEIVLWFEHDLFDQLALIRGHWTLHDPAKGRTTTETTEPEHSECNGLATRVADFRYVRLQPDSSNPLAFGSVRLLADRRTRHVRVSALGGLAARVAHLARRVSRHRSLIALGH